MKARRLLWHLRRGHISSVLELQTEMKVERNFLHASFTLQNLAASKQAFCLMADASVPVGYKIEEILRNIIYRKYF